LGRIHPDDADRVRRDITTHLNGFSSDFNNTHQIAKKDGSYIWVLTRGLAVHNAMASRAAWLGLSQISLRKKRPLSSCCTMPCTIRSPGCPTACSSWTA
jgi:hypothetical protein